jgi:hypothetical protein
MSAFDPKRTLPRKSSLRVIVPTLCSPGRTEVKTAALFTVSSTTQRSLSKKTARMGDKAKLPVTHLAGGFAVLIQPFCAARHFAKERDAVTCHGAMTSQGR